jgi:hypothetical protein
MEAALKMSSAYWSAMIATFISTVHKNTSMQSLLFDGSERLFDDSENARVSDSAYRAYRCLIQLTGHATAS